MRIVAKKEEKNIYKKIYILKIIDKNLIFQSQKLKKKKITDFKK